MVSIGLDRVQVALRPGERTFSFWVRQRRVSLVDIAVWLLKPVRTLAQLVITITSGSAHRAVQIGLHRVCHTRHSRRCIHLKLVAEVLQSVYFHTDALIEVSDQVLSLGQLAS